MPRGGAFLQDGNIRLFPTPNPLFPIRDDEIGCTVQNVELYAWVEWESRDEGLCSSSIARSRLGSALFLVVGLLLLVLLRAGSAYAEQPARLHWETPLAVDEHARPTGISCASLQLCVAVDNAGNVVVSTDPAGGAAATWVQSHVDGRGGLSAIACPSDGLCVAVDEVGDVVTSTEPAGGPGAWQVLEVDSGNRLTKLSCPSAGLCVAIDADGDTVISSDPTGGAAAWSDVHLSSGLSGVSCSNEKLCVLADTDGDILTSTDPAANPPTWSLNQVGAGGELACYSTSLCVTVGAGITWGDPSGAAPWTQATFEEFGDFDAVTCAPEGICLATSLGNGSPGNVLSSTDPAGGAGTWAESNSYGLPIVPSNPTVFMTIKQDAGLTCVRDELCALVDVEGHAIVGVVPLTNSGLPAVSGTPAPGQTLSCSNGSWAGYPPSGFGYQWLRDGAQIAGANAGTYTVQADDPGHGLACLVTAMNDAGSESAASATLQVPSPPPSGGGTGDVGSVLGGGVLGAPSNAFKLTGIATIARRGAVELTLSLPGPGALQIIGTASAAQLGAAARAREGAKTLVVARAHLTTSKGGRLVATLAPTPRAKAILATRGTLGAIITITYTPPGGAPRSIVRSVSFRMTRRH
jgi:hypothetical protein